MKALYNCMEHLYKNNKNPSQMTKNFLNTVSYNFHIPTKLIQEDFYQRNQ